MSGRIVFKRAKKQTSLPSEPVVYPSGTYVETENGYFYIFDQTKRYRIISKRVLESWSPHRVVKTSEAAVSKYRVTAKLKFRNGSLLWDLSDAKIYLVEGGKRRHVVSPDWFTRLGVTHHDLVRVSKAEVALHELGKELD